MKLLDDHGKILWDDPMILENIVGWYVSTKSRYDEPKQVCLSLGDHKHKCNLESLLIMQNQDVSSYLNAFVYMNKIKMLYWPFMALWPMKKL